MSFLQIDSSLHKIIRMKLFNNLNFAIIDSILDYNSYTSSFFFFLDPYGVYLEVDKQCIQYFQAAEYDSKS